MKLTNIFIVLSLLATTVLGQTDFNAYEQEIEGTGMSFKMVPIKGGDFTLGASAKDKNAESDELPNKQVKIESFWMGAFEVTHAEYLLFRDATRDLMADGRPFDIVVSRPSSPYEDPSKGLVQDDKKPAVGMTQYGALSYCRWLYYRTGVFYRIPTECEWEFAARSGVDEPYFFGKKKKLLDKYAWYAGNANGEINNVGLKEPSPNGLYDIYGNVAEWCLDQYYPDFYSNIEPNEKGPWGKPTALDPRSVRGGSFIDEAEECRSSNRISSTDKWKIRDPQIPKSFWWNTDSEFVGFRLVRPYKQPTKAEAEAFFVSFLE